MPELPGRDEQIIQSIIDGTEYTRVPQSRIEYLLLQLKQVIENGRTSDYNDIENKPQINSVTLVGNKSLSDLGIVNPIMIKSRVNSISDLPANAEPGWLYFVGYSDDADLREYVYTIDERWEFVGYLSMVIDSALSTTSENPVQNKVITNAMVGQKTTGKQYVIDGQTVTAFDGAEIFNDYQGNKATGVRSHAEGTSTQATGVFSHAEGGGTRATGQVSHAEGGGTQASGSNSHAEGGGTLASGDNSHAEGYNTIAKSQYQHAQGKYNVEDANGTYAFIIGNGTENARHNAFAIDWNGNIYVNGNANGVDVSKYAGKNITGTEYTIDGKTVTAFDGAEIFNDYRGNIATGARSHAEGTSTQATGDFSHAEGAYTLAKGVSSHAEGSNAKATGDYSHAEGYSALASGNTSHAEGSDTKATGRKSHAEGGGTLATGDYSHAEGGGTLASGDNSHAEGYNTIAKSQYQHAQGKYNVEDANGTYAFIIGNGTEIARHNAFAIDWNGNIYVNGSTTGVNVSTLSSILTPISESAYDALATKDKPLYFIYED